MAAEEVLTEAEEALTRGDIKAAEAALDRMWPNNNNATDEVMHQRAAIRFAQKRYSEAEALLRKAVAEQPKSLRHNIALGHLLTSQGNHSAAAEVYADALNINEAWPGLLDVFCVACYRSGRYANVEQAARRWIVLEPCAEAWNTLSCALRAQGRFADALAAAEEGLKLASDHVQAQHSKAAALLSLGRNREALELFNQLSDRGITAPALSLYRGQALQALDRKREAAETFSAGLAMWPASVALQQAYAAIHPRKQ